jgi:hypothetical protein
LRRKKEEIWNSNKLAMHICQDTYKSQGTYLKFRFMPSRIFMSSEFNWNSKTYDISGQFLTYLACVFANLEYSSESDIMVQRQYLKCLTIS